MPDIEYPQVGYGIAVALDEGTGSYNFAVLKESGTGLPVVLAAEGLDNNISIRLSPKGTGDVILDGTSTFGTDINVGVDYANYLTASGAPTTQAPYITTGGTDANVHLLLSTKNATSVVQMNRPFIQSVSSSLSTLVGLRSTYTAFWSNNNFTYAGAMDARFRVTGAVAGTITGSNFAINEFTIASDNVDATSSGGLSGLYIGMNAGGSNFVGNRTGVTAKVRYTTTSPNQTAFRFQTGGSFGAYIASATSPITSFGYGYDETDGYIFGGLLQARAEIGARYVKALQGLELNVGNQEDDVPVLDMGGIQVVMENDDTGSWMRQANAYGLANQTAWTGQGWHIGYAYAQANGLFALNRTYGTVLGGFDSQYGTAPAAAYGADFSLITLSQAAFRGSAGNSIIDGSGNIGGQIVAGTTLQTRSEVRAQTAVVNTITVVDGSLCLTIPTLTVAAPPGSGTQATAIVNQMAAAYMRELTGGTGYAVNDTVTLSGGTFSSAAIFTVSEVSAGGVPTRLTIATPGVYTVLPAGPVSTTTSGSGTGLTLTVWWTILTVHAGGSGGTVAGTNYPLYPPPLVTAAYTIDGGDRSPLRRPMFQVAMTGTRVQMQLNAGRINVTGIPTSSAGLASGDVWANANVLTVVP